MTFVFLYSQYIGYIFNEFGYIFIIHRLYIQNALNIKQTLIFNSLRYLFLYYVYREKHLV